MMTSASPVTASSATSAVRPRLFETLVPSQKSGVVYTRPWVAEMILDLAGYSSERDLAGLRAVEPAVGQGAFLLPIARRLMESCRRHGRRPEEAHAAILAYELDANSAATAALAVEELLLVEGTPPTEAHALALSWVRTGDYLLEAPRLPQADFVVGNPPYIRLEEINAIVASLYRARYTTMVGRADLYVAFFEAALRQLHPEGVCAFICADRWMLNAYGAELRRMVTSSFSVEAVVEMHQADAFDAEVSAYPAVTVIRRAPQGSAVVASAGSGSGGSEIARTLAALRQAPHPAAPPSEATDRALTQAVSSLSPGVRATRVEAWFSGSDPWPCASPERLALLKRLEAEFPLLESRETETLVGIGVATGCDEVFLTRDPALVESSRLLPLAMAGDARGGQMEWSGHYLVNPWDESGLVDLDAFPRLATYCRAHRERLQARSVGKRNPQRWHRTIDRVQPGLLEAPKLYIADIKSRLLPILDQGRTYPHHNLYYVRSQVWDAEVLGGLLLSQVAQFFVECYGVRMRGGYLRFQAQYLRRIRVPRREDISPTQSQALRDAFRRYDSLAATQVACSLYRLDAQERAALENAQPSPEMPPEPLLELHQEHLSGAGRKERP